jgi:ferric enterobactin receptor
MRLEVIIKYLSGITRSGNNILIIALITFSLNLQLNAQSYKLTFHNLPLSEALVKISREFDIKVAFDAEKLGNVIINKEAKGNSINEFLSDLLENTGFDYKFRYDRYLIVELNRDYIASLPEECQIVGSVSDRETGEQLPYASVILYNKNILTSASENGSFCIKNITFRPVHLMISYIGYYPVDTTISWTDPMVSLNIGLCRKVNLLDTIVVKGERLDMVALRNDVDFAATIEPSRLIDLPVSYETDVFRMLQLLPGISYSENSSGLSIRGGSGDQNLVLFDGQTLYNLSHYYGVVSALNPNVIKDLQVYKGGYDSRFGERVSGIIDITSKSGNQNKPVVYGDINLLSGNITAEIPVSKKLTVVAAARRSYSDIYSTGFANGLFDRKMDLFRGDSSNIVVQTRPSYYFYDYNSKITYRKSNLETFSLSIYGGKDYFKNAYSGTSSSLIIDAVDRNRWNNYGISATWLKQWNESFYSNLQIGTSGYSNESSNSTVINRTMAPGNNHLFLPNPQNDFNTFSRNDLKDLYLSLRNNYKFSNSNQLSFGMLVRKNSIYYHKDADIIYVYDNTDKSAGTYSLYLQDRLTFIKNLTIKPGIRVSYYDGRDGMFFEPRFSANYRISDAFSVRMATGRYYQFISQVLAQQETSYNKNFWVLADNYIHPELKSDHFIIGVTAGKGKLLLDAEAYIKSFTGLQEYIFISQFLKNADFPSYFPPQNGSNPPRQQPSYFVTGTGKSSGIDILLKYRGNNFTSWLSFSAGRSFQQFPDINNNARIPAPSDQPFQTSWTNMLTLGKWNFGAITLYSSGKPYIDYSRSSNNLPVTRVYNRLPDYFRSDLSVNYNFHISKAKLKTGITFLNIFNTQNYFDVNTRKFDFENTSFSETRLILSQSFSINMFLHFLF